MPARDDVVAEAFVQRIDVAGIDGEAPERRLLALDLRERDDLDDQLTEPMEPLPYRSDFAHPLQRSGGGRGDRIARALEIVRVDDDMIDADARRWGARRPVPATVRRGW